MKRTEERVDAVELMREIRKQLVGELGNKSFKEQKEYIRKHVQLPPPVAQARPNSAMQRTKGRS